jgi:hypothetical protein
LSCEEDQTSSAPLFRWIEIWTDFDKLERNSKALRGLDKVLKDIFRNSEDL